MKFNPQPIHLSIPDSCSSDPSRLYDPGTLDAGAVGTSAGGVNGEGCGIGSVPGRPAGSQFAGGGAGIGRSGAPDPVPGVAPGTGYASGPAE